MDSFLEAFDSYLIHVYRITGYTFIDFLIGTFIIALAAVIVGEFTISLAFLAVRKHIDKVTDEMIRFQNLSIDALASGSSAGYTTCNKLANDAFGKTFFMQVSLSAAFLWPVPFALAWMQYRFSEVEFQFFLTDYSVGYGSVFIVLYAAAYLAFKRIKYKLPYFRRIKEILDTYQQRTREMKTLADIFPKQDREKAAGRE